MSRRFLTPPTLPTGTSNPASGNIGDLFFRTDENAIYTYTSTGWQVATGGGGATVTISDTAPSSPALGDGWYNSTNGKVYTYYDNFWVENVSNIGTPPLTNISAVDGLQTALDGKASLSAPTFTGTNTTNGRIRAKGISADTSAVLELQSFDGQLNYIYKANSGGIVFTTGAGIAQVIDQSGRISMPSQPRFFAFRNAGNIAVGTVVLYNVDPVNIGSVYNPVNGRFTAPITGTYKFNAEGIFGTALGTYRLYYRINGAVYQGDYHLRIHNYNGGEYTAGSRELIVGLAAGDYVEMYFGVGPAEMYGLSQYATFSGYLLG